ncbi:MAG: glutathione-disulfide reductase [Polaromonas sp.]|uniref:glutathione-disulfide reductase n=1 Tax=Polaromonas sp. TaxID=1869339 RepID=UPI002487895E|nr:glutathione-disulfide reductase [Polaromonas sp.]MDI1269405.1 glutathione-disulfide reductase [Polaromonas sp.]
MQDFDVDLFVIGGGSGGVRAARVAAGHGARVALAEEYRVGGTCVIRGCVPKKLLVLASRFPGELSDSQGFGWRGMAHQLNWPALSEGIESEVSRLEGLYRKGLSSSGVHIYDERAVLTGPHSVQLVRSDTTVKARHILIATGGAPRTPADLVGGHHTITSNEVFALKALPNRVLVLGGGYIAVEFAGIFAGLGSTTTLLHRGERLLRGFDHELQSGLADAYRRSGIHLALGVTIASIEKTNEGFVVLDSAGGRYVVDVVLSATGRLPNTATLGLEGVGVETGENGAILVDAGFRTSIPSIFAVGDVTDRLNLTPVAIREGHALADALFGTPADTALDYESAPTAVFSTPELGTAGLTEEAARHKHLHLQVFKTDFRPMRATLANSSERIRMKVLVDGATDLVVGLHILGREAAELIQLAAVALQMGVTKRQLDSTLAVHPTMAEELVTMRTPIH